MNGFTHGTAVRLNKRGRYLAVDRYGENEWCLNDGWVFVPPDGDGMMTVVRQHGQQERKERWHCRYWQTIESVVEPQVERDLVTTLAPPIRDRLAIIEAWQRST